MNYVLDTAAGTNVTALMPAELLQRQNEACVACENRDKRRSGLPSTIADALPEAFDLQVIVPLVRPSDLRIVRVRRQHVINFALAPRSKRPNDVDSSIDTYGQKRPAITPTPLRIAKERRQHHLGQESKYSSEFDSVDGASPPFHSDDEDVRDVRQLNSPLSKRQRRDIDQDGGTEERTQDPDSRGLTFHPSPVDKDVHMAIRHHRHKGKVPQIFLRSIQQSPCVEFLATPPCCDPCMHLALEFDYLLRIVVERHQ